MDEENVKDSLEIDVDLVDILDYVGDSVRPIREGLAVRDADHIVCLGYTKQDTSYVHAKGYVLQSSHPGDRPHEVQLKIHRTDITKWDFTCSCKAGTKRCKHIIGCLLQINRFRTLEYMTCTDATQAWGYSKAEKTSLWGAKLIQDLCCVRNSKKLSCENEQRAKSFLEDAFDRLLKAAPSSAISKHKEGRFSNAVEFRTSISFVNIESTNAYCTSEELNSLLKSTDIPGSFPIESSTHQEFFNNVVQKDLNSIVQIAIDTATQSNVDWKLHRSMRITASTCYGLYTYSRNAAPDWSKKIASYLNPKTLQTKAMRFGKLTEEKAFLCYIRKRNPAVKKTGFVIHRKEPWLGGSPDGVDSLSKVVLEIKCPASGQDHDLKWMIDNCSATKKYVKQTVLNGEKVYFLSKNHAYFAQIQLNMHILNCSKGDFIVYSLKEDDFLLIEVEIDDNFITTLITTLKQIYFQYILPQLVERATK